MNCKVCNAEIQEGQAFCSYCGTKIETEPVQETVAPESDQSVEVEISVEGQNAAKEPVAEKFHAEVERSVDTPSDPADKNAIAGFILGICSLALCGIGFPAGIVGIILSAKGLRSKTKKGFAIPGLIISILSIFYSLSFWLGFVQGIVQSLLDSPATEYISILTQFLF